MPLFKQFKQFKPNVDQKNFSKMAVVFSLCHYFLQKQMYTKGDQKKKL